MKRILIFMLFSFSVVCFAAPPPQLTFDRVTDNVEFVTQCDVNQPAYAFEVQEYTFVNVGNFELGSYQAYMFDPVAKIEFPAMVMDDNYFAPGDQLKKPPSIQNLMAAVNKQHSNYGYPFSVN